MSNKMPIEWHEECYKNHAEYYKKKLIEIDKLQKQYEKDKEELFEYCQQIDYAKAHNMDGFDRNRLLQKKKGNEP